MPKLKVKVNSQRISDLRMYVIPDTGAQVTIGGEKQMGELGISRKDLKPAGNIELRNASKGKIEVWGTCTITIVHNGQACDEIVYFAPGVEYLFLSLRSCIQLKIINEKFPHGKVVNGVTQEEGVTETLIPFEPKGENVLQLKQWLLKEFEDVFDTNKELSTLDCKPHKIHLEDNAVPYAVTTPIPIPHNWREEVKKQLDEDVRKGVIRQVPLNQPTEWCMQMVVVAKDDGSPRRVINFNPINKYCKTETHYTPSPFNVVSNIPLYTYKTVIDAHNGYHQVPLDEDSIQYTTFLTILGRYQYLRTPQGHMSSGDAYTRRYDDIIADVPRKHKIVDDVLLHDFSIKQAFHHTYDYLAICREKGITVNPDKFKFAEKEVDFCGFTIGWENFSPSMKTISAIKDYPMPPNPTITDIRSWFSLVGQVAPFLITTELMQPFRELLKISDPKSKDVYWDDNLKKLFEASRDRISEIAKEGLKYYDTRRQTALITDWSKVGIGFILLQKYCNCSGINVSCCTNGWKLAFCASRFLHASEQNYPPIDGEALAVSWGLKKARMFLLGSQGFKIYSDHEPLIPIFNEKDLEKIENPRLLRFKERTSQYRFTMEHIAGKKNEIADALSRHPVSVPDAEDIQEALTINAISTDMLHNPSKAIALDLDDIRKTGNTDQEYQSLMKICRFPPNQRKSPKGSVQNNVLDKITVVNGMLVYTYHLDTPRMIIPKQLRPQVIQNLHAANQGTTSMIARARTAVYWPGMDKDISDHVSSCTTCREHAPSKPREPLISTDPPSYPFQKVASDLFEIGAEHYLVYVDRLTGFPELAHFPNSTTSSVIINTMREFFHRWGVPEEMSLDGAPNLKSVEIKEWLTSWNVNVRLSSAYYAQSNGRAEAGVKSMKRLLRGNQGRKGTLNTDELAAALLQYRNTPLREVNKSPAQLALGREMRDTIPLPRERYRVNKNWLDHLKTREETMSLSNEVRKREYDISSRDLKALAVGDKVLCQNTRSNKWDRSGSIVEVGKFRQYQVIMDGSGRISTRNRRHLQKIIIPDRCIPSATHSTEMTTSPMMNEETVEKIPSQHSGKSVTFKETTNRITEPMQQQQQNDANDAPETETTIPQPRRSTRKRVQPKRYTNSI
jgi:hypothetical protein